MHLTGWPFLAVRVGVTLVIAVLSYRYVEQPIRLGIGAPARLRRLAPALAAVLVLAVFVSTNGAPTTPAAAATNVRGGILVVGDSVAGSLRPGLVGLGPPVAESWSPGCRLISGTLRFENLFTQDCSWRKDWTAVVDQQHPDTVVLLPAVWDLFDVRPTHSKSYLVPGTRQWARTYAAALESAISVLGSTGARIVLPTMPCVGAVPGTKHGMGSALDIAARARRERRRDPRRERGIRRRSCNRTCSRSCARPRSTRRARVQSRPCAPTASTTPPKVPTTWPRSSGPTSSARTGSHRRADVEHSASACRRSISHR